MLVSGVIAGLTLLSVIFGLLTGNMGKVSSGIMEGTASAVALLLKITGNICIWSGLMEVMQRSGLAEKAARLLRPLILFLFGKYGKDPEARDAISQNMAANLLGLGSAATPAGLRAAARLQALAKQDGVPPDGVMLLIVLNTASLQLIPTTIAAVRAGLGAARPYDILGPVWLSSAISISVGVLACFVMKRWWKR